MGTSAKAASTGEPPSTWEHTAKQVTPLQASQAALWQSLLHHERLGNASALYNQLLEGLWEVDYVCVWCNTKRRWQRVDRLGHLQEISGSAFKVTNVRFKELGFSGWLGSTYAYILCYITGHKIHTNSHSLTHTTTPLLLRLVPGVSSHISSFLQFCLLVCLFAFPVCLFYALDPRVCWRVESGVYCCTVCCVSKKVNTRITSVLHVSIFRPLRCSGLDYKEWGISVSTVRFCLWLLWCFCFVFFFFFFFFGWDNFWNATLYIYPKA